MSFAGRPRIGDWGEWLEIGEPNGTNGGAIIQISNAGIKTGTSTGITVAPTLRNTLDDGHGNMAVDRTIYFGGASSYGVSSLNGNSLDFTNGSTRLGSFVVDGSYGDLDVTREIIAPCDDINGGVGGSCPSDISIKHDINYMPDQDSLNTLLKLKPATFYYNNKKYGMPLDWIHYGFIAEDIQRDIPNSPLNGGPSPRYGGVNTVNYAPIQMMQIGAIKAEEAQIVQLQQQNAQLQQQIQQLQQQVQQLMSKP